MRNLYFVFVATLLIVCNHVQGQTDKIGVNAKGKYVIVNDMRQLKSDWAEILKGINVNEQLSLFQIVKKKDLVLNKYYYALLASDNTNKIKCATFLVYKNNSFYVKKTAPAFVVTCTGESESCIPNVLKGRWICGNTPNGKCTKDCTKTVSVSE